MDWFEDNHWEVNAKCDSLNRELFGSMLSEELLKAKEKEAKKGKRKKDHEHKNTGKKSKLDTSFTVPTKASPLMNTEKIILSKKQKRRLKEKIRIRRKKKERLAHQAVLLHENTASSSKTHIDSGKESVESRNKETQKLSKHNRQQEKFTLQNKGREVKKSKGKMGNSDSEPSSKGDKIIKQKEFTDLGEKSDQIKRKKKHKKSSKNNKYKHLAHNTNLEICKRSHDECGNQKHDKVKKENLFKDSISKSAVTKNIFSGESVSKVNKSDITLTISGKKKKSKSQMKKEQKQNTEKKKIEFTFRRLKDFPSETCSTSSYSEVSKPDRSLKGKMYVRQNETSSRSNIEPEKADEVHTQPNISRRKLKNMSVRDRIKEKLDSARFRFLNEQLYVTSGHEAFNLFDGDNDAFKIYHKGFQTQVSKWPINPLDVIIKYFRDKPKNLVIADLGCGEAKLAQSVQQKVHSFDLVALNKYVTVCDIAKIPLKHDSVDVVVFCLSLMGTNLTDYLTEANRILKNGGIMKIAEVTSRFKRLGSFVSKVEKMGFNALSQDTSNTMFVMMDFEKKSTTKKSVPPISLDPCVYKKR